MKKTIYIFVSFSLHDWDFETSVHETLEEAKAAQWEWLEYKCIELGWKIPEKDSLYNCKDERFKYKKDKEYIKLRVPDCTDEISTIEIKEITI